MNEIETTSTRSLATVLAAAESDPAFRARLLENGGAALAELGFEPTPGVTVKVVEDTSDVLHLVLPALPTLELAADDLDQIAGGASTAGDIFATLIKGVDDLANGTKDVAVLGGKI